MKMARSSFLKRARERIFSVLLFSLCVAGLFCSAFAADIVVYGDSQIYGDIQAAEAAQRAVVQAVLQKKPSIVFRVGDLVMDGHDPQQWEVFNNISSELLTTTEYYPCLGNHEGDSPLYFDNFKNINRQHWYSVDREGIRFIVLDSNSPLGKESPQYAWLEAELSRPNSDIRFILVFFHHPLFDVGSHNEDEKGLRPLLVPLFEKYGVGAVFSGHDHSYQRFLYQHIDYIVTGGGGSPLHDQVRMSPYLQKFSKTHHFCLLSSDEHSLTAKVFDVDLNLIDEFTISSINAEKTERNTVVSAP